MRIVVGFEAAESVLFQSRTLDLSSVPQSFAETTRRVFGADLTPLESVDRIVRTVREDGDAGVMRMAQAIEGRCPDVLEVEGAAITSAINTIDRDVYLALYHAEERIRRYHENVRKVDWMDFRYGYGAVTRPCESVGVYVPGGTAPLPSTVLMTAVPAKVAGVGRVILCSPPGEGGVPDPVVLAAAHIAGVSRVFSIGGAQAIAAMAYGTESVPQVDLVCGPGNIFVTLAKKLVFGDVGIDGLYGPTETLIVGDDGANATLCAADMLAQAEHDPMAQPVLICTSEQFARQVSSEVETRLQRLDRVSIARAAIEGQGCIAVVDDLDDAIQLANWFAPEHLSLSVENPWDWIGKVKNAGAIFVGEFSHEVLGDYIAGPSHVMPTSGTARFNSGLGVHTFLKTIPIVALNERDSAMISGTAAIIARAEGLTAHAEAAEIRSELSSRRSGKTEGRSG